MRRCEISRAPVRQRGRPQRQAPTSLLVHASARATLSGQKDVGPAHMNWLMLQKLEHREQRIVLEELLGAVRQESERVERLEQAIRDAVPEWSLAEVVTALQAMRGIDLVAAVTVLAEIHGAGCCGQPQVAA